MSLKAAFNGSYGNSSFIGGALKLANSQSDLKAYARGAAIQVGAGTGFALVEDAAGTSTHFGPFNSGRTGFAGFKLPNGDNGWVRLEPIDRNGDGILDAVEAIDWAYNDVSGQSILARQVPEPGTNALALGSAGVLAWRKHRAQPAA